MDDGQTGGAFAMGANNGPCLACMEESLLHTKSRQQSLELGRDGSSGSPADTRSALREARRLSILIKVTSYPPLQLPADLYGKPS
jgi:hypothetical protein